MTKLLFGVHMHQPVDNLGVAVEQAVKLCYAPFFELMSQYPKFKFALHSNISKFTIIAFLKISKSVI